MKKKHTQNPVKQLINIKKTPKTAFPILEISQLNFAYWEAILH
ncbi:hypothetical protein [Xanthomarina gelatinilytica]